MSKMTIQNMTTCFLVLYLFLIIAKTQEQIFEIIDGNGDRIEGNTPNINLRE